jgi:membrane protein
MSTHGRNKVVGFFTDRVWEIDTGPLGKFKTFVIKTVRLASVVIREFTEGHLTLRAMSLVYTTLLSIVPVLAISFSVLKAFGVHNELVEPFLIKFLAPLGSRGEEITLRIIGFVENMKVGVLGSLGLGMLLYTVVSVIQKVENSFNAIWRIRKPRSFARRFSDYVSVIIIGPVLMFSAIGLTASFMSNTFVQTILSIEPFGTLLHFVISKVPYLIVCAAFTFLYVFIPNTRVKFRSALIGGVLAGFMWETAGWAFASFVVTSTKYAAVYSGFAILLMFMIWLYVSWLILLVGAQISFYNQYPHFLTVKKEALRLSHRLMEKLAFLIMYYIGFNYYYGKTPWTLNALVYHLKLPVDAVHDVLFLLEKNSFVTETGDDPPAYVPGRDIERITLNELIHVIRVPDESARNIEQDVMSAASVDGVIDTVESAMTGALNGMTLKDIVVSKDTSD